MKTFTIRVSEILKIRKYENATVIYTEKTAWVCVPTQPLPKSEDLFITLQLKEKN